MDLDKVEVDLGSWYCSWVVRGLLLLLSFVVLCVEIFGFFALCSFLFWYCAAGFLFYFIYLLIFFLEHIHLLLVNKYAFNQKIRKAKSLFSFGREKLWMKFLSQKA